MPSDQRPPAVGDVAPPLQAPTVAGAPFVLADRNRDIALVTFLRHAG